MEVWHVEDDSLALVQSGLVCGHPAPGLALTTGDPGQQQAQEELGNFLHIKWSSSFILMERQICE